jgi:antitoxin VapB
MNTAKVFQSGNSQAIRLPSEFRLDTNKVYISRQGTKIIIEPIEPNFDSLESILDRFSTDMTIERNQPPVQERDSL